MGLSASAVDYILNRFFGYTVPHKTPINSNEWKYRNGEFIARAASGGPEPDFTIATKMIKCSDGNYEVKFNVYHDGIGRAVDIYALSVSEVESWCEHVGYGTAILRNKVFNGKNTYELVSYDVDYIYHY